VILYAASPGAFVDLAADLSWLARLKLDEFALDQHLPSVDPDTVGVGQAASLITRRSASSRQSARAGRGRVAC